MVIWIDVADLLDYAATHARPTGIQRMALEIAAALHAASGAGCEVRFVRYQPQGRLFLEIKWPAIASLFAPRPGAKVAHAVIRTGGAPPPRGRGPVRAWLARVMPPAFRAAAGRAVRAQIAAMKAVGEVFTTGLRDPSRQKRRHAGTAADIAAGDVLLNLGSPWEYPDYGASLAALHERGVRIGAFVHDMIPLRRPQWCYPGTVRDFQRWFTTTAPLCDHLFVASDATGKDIRIAASRLGLTLHAQIHKLPIGTGFTAPPGPPLRHLPAPGSYALFVSTIEPRKNHALLIRVWQRLLETHKREAVPRLVFAGRAGWMVGDLLQQLENAAHLDEHILRIEGATDAELAALYRGALFTLYPSFYEGWGLPVVESLAFGTPCIAANTTSLPEAGGTLARYLDPDDLHDAVRVISEAIDDPAGLADWKARIAREFRPVPWSATALALIDALHKEPAQ